MYKDLLDHLGKPHIHGTVTWENCGKYDGEWVGGRANNHGTMHYKNGNKCNVGWTDC